MSQLSVKAARNYYLVNFILILSSFFVFLSKITTPNIFQIIIGALLFFSVGINLCLILCTAKSIIKIHIFELIPLAAFLSMWTSAIIFFITLRINNNIIMSYYQRLAFVVFTSIVLLAMGWSNKYWRSKIELRINNTARKFWLLTFLIFITFLAINWVLYKYIPEYDCYLYLHDLEIGWQSKTLVMQYPDRLLFYSLSLAIHTLTTIQFYWLFKIFYSIFFASLIYWVFLLLALRNYKNKLLSFCIVLLPFSIPAIALELFFPRPNTLMLAFLIVYFGYSINFMFNKNKKFAFRWTFFVLSAIGILFHEFFLVPMIISLVVILKEYYNKTIYKRLYLSFALFLIVSFLLGSAKYSPMMITSISDSIIRQFTHLKLNLWFLDSYTNFDKSQNGWPGLTFIIYYLYNLGVTVLLIPIILLRKIKLYDKIPLVIIAAGLIFLFPAEIMPRLGLFYYPDRALQFLAISVLFIFLQVLLTHNFSLKQQKAVLGLIIIAILGIIGVTYYKAGPINSTDLPAASEIHSRSIDPDAVFISQPNNRPLIRYFASQEDTYDSEKFFTAKDDEQRKAYLEHTFTYINHNVYVLYSSNIYTGLYMKRQWWRESNFINFDPQLLENKIYLKKVYDKNGLTIWQYVRNS